jgi:transposase
MIRASRGRRCRCVSRSPSTSPATHRPLDIVEGRSKRVLRAWLAVQTSTRRAGVRIAALDLPGLLDLDQLLLLHS